MLDRISAGRTDLIFEWLAQGGDHSAIHDGASLIAWCAYYGDVSAMRRLLDHGVKLADLGPSLGLNGAAFHGHWQLCQFLIERGADPHATEPDTGETPLHSALCKFESIAHERVVEVLLASGTDVMAATKPGAESGCFMRDVRTRGETALHRAAAVGTHRTIGMLIDAGAARDARDANGDTPLSWASWALRDAPILHLLCHGRHTVDLARRTMAENLLGDPFP